MAKKHDVIVIGFGTAGQTAAFELNQNGLNVGLVEHSERPGGTCALSGCQAKKWFYEGAEIVARSRHLSGIGLSSPAEAKMTLPIEGAHLMLSSDEFLELDRLSRRIVFIGGGFISFELAHFAARLGPAETQCIILEAASKPLGPFDEDRKRPWK